MNTLFDKIWDAHVINTIPGGPSILYIDRQFCNEVTSPHAFSSLRERGLEIRHPEKTICTIDHNQPTTHQDLPVPDAASRHQIETMQLNAQDFSLTLFDVGSTHNGITHVIGPENGLSAPGLTIACGGSHASTHGALGALALPIGTSEIESVLATQCILQTKPRSMRITVDGELKKGVSAKDLILHIINKISPSGAVGYIIEFAGTAIRQLSIEERMTMCNMSTEMGAKSSIIAPDEKTFAYLKGREFSPVGEDWVKTVDYWKTLRSDEHAVFDREIKFKASDVKPRITYGTAPHMSIEITAAIPRVSDIPQSRRDAFSKSLGYMHFTPGQKMLGIPVDYVFLGSCANGRIEDFRTFASFVKGRHKAQNVTAWLVPGSNKVLSQIKAEGLDKVLSEAGFEVRQPGCSACCAINPDKIPSGKLVVSTSNRNFENSQGLGARTIIASPATAAAAAITGVISNPLNL